MSTKSSLRIQSDSCSIYAHTCWQVDCDKNLFSSFIVQNWLRKHPPVRTCTISRHVPFTFSSPQVPEVSSCFTGWHPWATAVLEAHSCSQEGLPWNKSPGAICAMYTVYIFVLTSLRDLRDARDLYIYETFCQQNIKPNQTFDTLPHIATHFARQTAVESRMWHQLAEFCWPKPEQHTRTRSE